MLSHDSANNETPAVSKPQQQSKFPRILMRCKAVEAARPKDILPDSEFTDKVKTQLAVAHHRDQAFWHEASQEVHYGKKYCKAISINQLRREYYAMHYHSWMDERDGKGYIVQEKGQLRNGVAFFSFEYKRFSCLFEPVEIEYQETEHKSSALSINTLCLFDLRLSRDHPRGGAYGTSLKEVGSTVRGSAKFAEALRMLALRVRNNFEENKWVPAAFSRFTKEPTSEFARILAAREIAIAVEPHRLAEFAPATPVPSETETESATASNSYSDPMTPDNQDEEGQGDAHSGVDEPIVGYGEIEQEQGNKSILVELNAGKFRDFDVDDLIQKPAAARNLDEVMMHSAEEEEEEEEEEGMQKNNKKRKLVTDNEKFVYPTTKRRPCVPITVTANPPAASPPNEWKVEQQDAFVNSLLV